MTTLIIPPKPQEWVASTNIVIAEGCKPHCKCVRPWNSVTPWVVHHACVEDDGTWSYHNGSYFRDLTEAMNYFNR